MALYTKLTEDDARSILSLYGFDLVAVSYLPGGAMNSSYVVDYTIGRVDLRSVHNRPKKAVKKNGKLKVRRAVLTVLDGAVDLDAAIRNGRLLNLLSGMGVSVDGVIPLPTADQQLVAFVVAGEDGGPKPVMLRRFVKGHQPDVTAPGWMTELGELIGSFGDLDPNFFQVVGGKENTRRIPDSAFDEIGPDADPRLIAAISSVIDYPSVLGWDDFPKAVCHGDLFPDNIIRRSKDGALVAIDWELASIDTPVIDLGLAAAGSWDALKASGVSSGLREMYEAFSARAGDWGFQEGDLGLAMIYGLVLLAYRRYVVSNVWGRDPRKDWHVELLDKLELLRSMQ